MPDFRLLGPAELRADDGKDLAGLLAQPKPLAFLAYLAVTRPSGLQRRDTLTGIFWPELDQDRARAAVRQTLYTIRKSAGPIITTRGDDEVGVDPEKLSCDVWRFRDLVHSDPATAMSVYRGPLLQGLFVREAPEFERWLETERSSLRAAAALASWRLAESTLGSDPDVAFTWARRAFELDPFDERAVRRLMEMFAQSGRSASALHLYAGFEEMLARELETAPSKETKKLAASIRSAPEPRIVRADPAVPLPDDVISHATSDVPARPPRSRLRRIAGGAGALAAVLAGLLLYRSAVSESAPIVVAVGAVQSFGGAGTDSATAAVRALLAANLSRIEGVEVISDARLLEIARGDASASALVRSARRAGARNVLEGSLFTEANGALRLQLKWTAPGSGRSVAITDVLESDGYAAANAATAAIARSLGREAPVLPLRGVTTRSLTAYRLFEAGLRAYYRDHVQEANVLFGQAVAEDSLFAQALWYYGANAPYPANQEARERAFRYADHIGDHERLFIRANYFAQNDDPRAIATADTLSVRYPSDPSGVFLAGYTRMWNGDFLGAIPKFRAVLRLDSASIREEGGSRCWACQALWEIGTAYGLADSVDAHMRHAQWWVKTYPHMRGAWFALANAHDALGDVDEAITALQRGIVIEPYDSTNQGAAEILMRAGDFVRADSVLRERIRSVSPELRSNGLFMYSMSLRNQRRFDEAIAATKAARALATTPDQSLFDAMPVATALDDAGQHRAALVLWDSIARQTFAKFSVARNARSCATHLTRIAEAHAALRDTAAVLALLPRIDECARATAFGPARTKPHHLRGLILESRGDVRGAIAEYRAAMFSPTQGDTRLNLHVGRLLLRDGRPAEAAAIVEAALRGSVGGGGYYVTHRALHEVALRAWTEAGDMKRAAVHRAWLAKLPSASRVAPPAELPGARDRR